MTPAELTALTLASAREYDPAAYAVLTKITNHGRQIMASLGSMKIGLLVRIGDGEPVEMGTVTVPLKVNAHDNNTLFIDIGGPLDAVREMFRQVFTDDNQEGTK